MICTVLFISFKPFGSLAYIHTYIHLKHETSNTQGNTISKFLVVPICVCTVNVIFYSQCLDNNHTLEIGRLTLSIRYSFIYNSHSESNELTES